MYALVKTGGKQYRVSKDDNILVERVAADEGTEVILNDIVMLADGDKVTIGTPKVEGAAVSATIEAALGIRPAVTEHTTLHLHLHHAARTDSLQLFVCCLHREI